DDELHRDDEHRQREDSLDVEAEAVADVRRQHVERSPVELVDGIQPEEHDEWKEGHAPGDPAEPVHTGTVSSLSSTAASTCSVAATTRSASSARVSSAAW